MKSMNNRKKNLEIDPILKDRQFVQPKNARVTCHQCNPPLFFMGDKSIEASQENSRRVHGTGYIGNRDASPNK